MGRRGRKEELDFRLDVPRDKVHTTAAFLYLSLSLSERSASLRELRMRGTKLHAGSNPRRISHTSKLATASRARPRRFPESPGPRNATGRGNNVGAQ